MHNKTSADIVVGYETGKIPVNLIFIEAWLPRLLPEICLAYSLFLNQFRGRAMVYIETSVNSNV